MSAGYNAGMLSTDEWIRIALGVIGTLIGVIAWFFWREIRRIAKRVHDTNHVVARHEIWITVIREKLRIGSRRDDE